MSTLSSPTSAVEHSDYLVTDCEDEKGHEPAFSDRRAWHLFGVDRSCCTSPRLPADVEYSDDAGGSLDAPMHMAAGSCFADHCLFSDVPQSDFKREHWPLFGESERPFSDRRGLYRSRSNCLCTSGGRHPCGLRYFDAAGNNLDSPEFVATGATKQVGKLYGGMAQVISRNCLSLEPLPEPFTARRGWWRKWAEAIGVARSGPLGGMNLPSVSRPGFECESLDAPEFLPAGSVKWVGVDFGSTGFPSLRLVMRDWVNKPRLFGGQHWRGECAAVKGGIECGDARAWRDIDELWVGSVGKNW